MNTPKIDTDYIDTDYIDLLEIDGFRVVEDKNFSDNTKDNKSNFTTHWIAHMCEEYAKQKEADEDFSTSITGIFDSDEIHEGKCYYCKTSIPEPIIALWSMLEWQVAGDILHSRYTDKPHPNIQVSNGTP